jgi:2-keto-3-deoxy-6-phosphogluconate aldolase
MLFVWSLQLGMQFGRNLYVSPGCTCALCEHALARHMCIAPCITTLNEHSLCLIVTLVLLWLNKGP